ncbi:histidine kinase [Streptomyces sp. NBC_00073]|uniref:histidine kinase n=1 Tax=Streptomyces sp. NBC_00073 TaxID=2975640 RepID=UPI00324308FB
MSGYRFHDDRTALTTALAASFLMALALGLTLGLAFVLVLVLVSAGPSATSAALVLALAAVLGLVVCRLAVRAHRLRGAVTADHSYLARLEGTAWFAEDGASPGAVVERVRHELVGLLELHGCRFAHGSLSGQLPRLEHDGSVWLGHGAGATEAVYWPDRWPDGETELRAVGGGHCHGRFLLDPVPGALPPEGARLAAVALAAQAGAALDAAGPAHRG